MQDHEELGSTQHATSARLQMIIAFVLVSVVRFWFSFDRHTIHVSPDEPSQLAIARFLAGERRWNMFDHATWQPGLGTLISPIYWFTTDGETVVRWALGFNALMGGAAAAVMIPLTRRLTGVSPWVAAGLAIAVALTPASLSASSFVWAEPLVALAVAGTLLALMRYHGDDHLRPALGAIAFAIAGYTAHSRLLPLVATTVALTVGRALWRRRWRHAVGLSFSAVALFALSALWKDWLLSRIWDDPSNQNTIDAVFDRLSQPVAVAESLAGQIWYQLAATFGIFAIGAIVLTAAAFTRRSDADRPPGSVPIRPIDARVVVLSTLPLIGLSAIFMSDRPRADQFIYGRYNDAVVWPVIVIGLAWIGQRVRHGFRRRDLAMIVATTTATLGLGGLIEALHGDSIRESYGVRGMIAGLLAFVDASDTLDVWRTTWTTVAVFAGAVVVVRIAQASGRARRQLLAIGVAAVAGLFVVGAVRTRDVVDAKLNGWDTAAAVREVDALVPDGLALAVRPVPSSQDPVVGWVAQRQRFLLYQLYLPERSFVRDRGTDDEVGPYVFAPLEDEQMLEADAQLIWTDPAIRIGLWEEPPTP